MKLKECFVRTILNSQFTAKIFETIAQNVFTATVIHAKELMFKTLRSLWTSPETPSVEGNSSCILIVTLRP